MVFMIKGKHVRVCPVCGSPEIRVDKSNKVMERYSMGINYVCARCGNTFSIPLEVDADKASEIEPAPLTDEVLHATPNRIRVGEGYASMLLLAAVAAVIIIVTIAIAFLSGAFGG